MQKNRDQRALGDFRSLLGPFHQSFRAGMAEIPANIDRSHRNIETIGQAAAKAEAEIQTLLRNGRDGSEQVRTNFAHLAGEKRRVGRRLALSFVWFRLQLALLYLRLFWKKYRAILLFLIALVAVLWFLTNYAPAVWQQGLDWLEGGYSWLQDLVGASDFDGAGADGSEEASI